MRLSLCFPPVFDGVGGMYVCMYVHMCMHVPVYGAYGDQRPVLGFVPHASYVV